MASDGPDVGSLAAGGLAAALVAGGTQLVRLVADLRRQVHDDRRTDVGTVLESIRADLERVRAERDTARADLDEASTELRTLRSQATELATPMWSSTTAGVMTWANAHLHAAWRDELWGHERKLINEPMQTALPPPLASCVAMLMDRARVVVGRVAVAEVEDPCVGGRVVVAILPDMRATTQQIGWVFIAFHAPR